MQDKIGRNDPCWCGSGKKYKKCHLHQDILSTKPAGRSVWENVLGEFGEQSMARHIEAIANDPSREREIAARAESVLQSIRHQKEFGTRPKPSQRCVLGESAIPQETRAQLLDFIASLVDENWAGRSEMCVPFAVLLRDAVREMGFDAIAVFGEATYFNPSDNTQKFTWNHAWVLISDTEIVDGNVDSIVENPYLDPNSGIKPAPFWGPMSELPGDRIFVEKGVITRAWEEENIGLEALCKWRTRVSEEVGKYGTPCKKE